jgi:hypothetical protein
MAKVYILCKQYPEVGAVTFVCGPDPRMPTFHPTPEPAARFEEMEDALLFRSLMPHQLGGTEKYRVHELLPDGRIIDVEA